jgi:adenylyl-sulfate kinase
MNHQQSNQSGNITWHSGKVTQAEREAFFKQKPATIWLTGLSGSGKSTIAFELERQLFAMGQACYVLDGDNIRHGLCRDLNFTPESRTENIRRVAEVARLLNDAGLFVITAFISPYRTDRAIAKSIIGDDKFCEVWLATDIDVCESRDPKGLYHKARQGLIGDFTGISAPYEEPKNADIRIDTAVMKVYEAVDCIVNQILSRIHNA